MIFYDFHSAWLDDCFTTPQQRSAQPQAASNAIYKASGKKGEKLIVTTKRPSGKEARLMPFFARILGHPETKQQEVKCLTTVCLTGRDGKA